MAEEEKQKGRSKEQWEKDLGEYLDQFPSGTELQQAAIAKHFHVTRAMMSLLHGTLDKLAKQKGLKILNRTESSRATRRRQGDQTRQRVLDALDPNKTLEQVGRKANISKARASQIVNKLGLGRGMGRQTRESIARAEQTRLAKGSRRGPEKGSHQTPTHVERRTESTARTKEARRAEGRRYGRPLGSRNKKPISS